MGVQPAPRVHSSIMMCITRSAFDSRLWQTSYGGANLYALVGFPLHVPLASLGPDRDEVAVRSRCAAYHYESQKKKG